MGDQIIDGNKPAPLTVSKQNLDACCPDLTDEDTGEVTKISFKRVTRAYRFEPGTKVCEAMKRKGGGEEGVCVKKARVG